MSNPKVEIDIADVLLKIEDKLDRYQGEIKDELKSIQYQLTNLELGQAKTIVLLDLAQEVIND